MSDETTGKSKPSSSKGTPPGHVVSAFDVLKFIIASLVVYGIYNFILAWFLNTPNTPILVKAGTEIKSGLLVFSSDKTHIDSVHVSSQLSPLPSFNRKKVYFSEHPPFLFWYFSISLVNALAIVLLWPIFLNIRNGYRGLLPRSQKKFWMLSGVGLILASAFYLSARLSIASYVLPVQTMMDNFNILYDDHSHWIMKYFCTLPSQLTGTAGVAGIGLLVLIGGDLKWSSVVQNEQSAKRIVALREQFRLYVYMISGLILMGALNTGIFREVLLSFLGQDVRYFFPIEFTWAYRIMFSCILALVYFPVFYYFEQQNEKIAQAVKDGADVRVPTDTKEKTWNTVKIILAALAPLLGTFVQELITKIVTKV